MELFTSRYSNQREIIESKLIPVGISVGLPKFALKYELVERMMMLAPTGGLFGIKDPDEC
tara:strand:- start:549 stop:728 length:180 start_codon:yes stop_codon:yes gene_type:complete